jgi:hypothetical protein
MQEGQKKYGLISAEHPDEDVLVIFFLRETFIGQGTFLIAAALRF